MEDVLLRFKVFKPRIKKCCGVYLLKYANDIVYIGQSVDIALRIKKHRCKNRHKIFSEVFWYEVLEQKERIKLESDLIQYVIPTFNVANTGYTTTPEMRMADKKLNKLFERFRGYHNNSDLINPQNYLTLLNYFDIIQDDKDFAYSYIKENHVTI